MAYRFIQEFGDGWKSEPPFPPNDPDDRPSDAREGLTPEAVADEVVAASEGSCVILLGAASVFFSRFSADEVQGVRNHQTLAFRFEEDLPFDAEQLACDFRFEGEAKSGENVSAIGTRLSSLEPLVHAVQSRGGTIRGVCPWSLLATQAIVRAESLGSQGCLVFQRRDGLSFVAWQNQQVVGWRAGVAERIANAELQLFAEPLGVASNVYIVDGTEEFDLPRDHDHGLSLDPIQGQISSAGVASAVAELLDSKDTLWCDFLRAPRLSRSSSELRLKRTLMVAAMCCLVVTISLFAKSWLLEQRRSDDLDQQSEVFAAAFPGTRVPSAVLRRLRSERTKLRGISDPTREVPQKGRALPVLGTVLGSLPADVDFTVEEVRADDRNATLVMLLRDYEAAATVVKGLSQTGFEVGPPATEAVGNELRAVIAAAEKADD